MILAVLNIILDVYSMVLLVRIVLSFIGMQRYANQVVRFIYDVTDITLKPIQKVLRPVAVGDVYLDFAPLIVLLIINIIQRYI